MTHLTADDGVRLFIEELGSGTPLLFIHEFAGDHRSWVPQVDHFAAGYRCITYAARGYPPSDVPRDPAAYSQERAVQDAIAVLNGLGIAKAHIVGLSMGGFCALHVGLTHASRVLSLVAAGCGYGAMPDTQDRFRAECEAVADRFRDLGAPEVAKTYSVGPARVQLQNKNPDGWRAFAEALAEHSSTGAELTMRGVQRARPSLYSLRPRLAQLTIPTLIIAGDEDEGSLEPALMLKRAIPTAGLSILPKTGHTLNLEDPAEFNRLVGWFLQSVERGEWTRRDPRSLTNSITGITADAP